jgi:hypothetical protein
MQSMIAAQEIPAPLLTVTPSPGVGVDASGFAPFALVLQPPASTKIVISNTAIRMLSIARTSGSAAMNLPFEDAVS